MAFVLGAAGLASGLVYTACLYAKSQQEFTVARAALVQGVGSVAIINNLAAIQTFPLDWLSRHQLGLTLTYLVSADKQAVVEPRAADSLYALSRSASPWSPSTLVGRVAYLVASGRIQERREETDELLGYLTKHARKQGSVWTAEMMAAASLGQNERAIAALNNGLVLTSPQDEALEDLKRILRAIAPREAE